MNKKNDKKRNEKKINDMKELNLDASLHVKKKNHAVFVLVYLWWWVFDGLAGWYL